MNTRALILLITLSLLSACSNDSDVAENSTAANSTENNNPDSVADDDVTQNQNTIGGTDSETGTDTDAGNDTGTGTDNNTDTGTDNDTDTETDNDSDTETGNNTDTGTDNGPDTETGNDTDTGTDNDTDTGTDNDTGTGTDNDTGTGTDNDTDTDSMGTADTDLMQLLSNGSDSSSATGYWRCGFQRPDSASLPINFQFFNDGGGAMTAGPTDDMLFNTQDSSTAWMVMDGTLTVQAGGDFGPINMSMIDFSDDDNLMSVLSVPGRTSGTISCGRSSDVSIPDEFAQDDSTLNEYLLTNPGQPVRTYWECKVVGSGGNFTEELEFFSDGLGKVNGVAMQWIITQDDYIQYISTAAPIDTITLELIDIGPSPEGDAGLYFAASHYRINDNQVSGTVECFGRQDIPDIDGELTALPGQLVDPDGLDTAWNCAITGSNSQNHVLDFNADRNGTEDGVAMTWMITPDDYIRYVRSDNEYVITIENVEFTAGTDPLGDQIYADHYRINDGPESIQGFVECQRVLTGT